MSLCVYAYVCVVYVCGYVSVYLFLCVEREKEKQRHIRLIFILPLYSLLIRHL